MVAFSLPSYQTVILSLLVILTVQMGVSTFLHSMNSARFVFFPLIAAIKQASSQSTVTDIDTSWYAPMPNDINNLSTVVNGSGVFGFNFDASGVSDDQYGVFNWANMPHVRTTEYPRVNSSCKLEFVEVIHRHHKRTPYAANTFPKEGYAWDCSDEGLFYHGAPLPTLGANQSADTYWEVYTSPSNPLAPEGFNGTCQFPQITRGGLDDSWQHGKDLFDVYHGLLNFLPATYDSKLISFAVTNNVITSQVAGMLISGMYPDRTGQNTPLLVQPNSIDPLEPAYTCTAASNLYSSFASGSTAAGWQAHLTASAPLFAALDAISGVAGSATDWHVSWDHYYDNLSSRLAHGKPLPCSMLNTTLCVTRSQADQVFRLGQWEYSYTYRAAGPSALDAAIASYGIWSAQLAADLRCAMATAEALPCLQAETPGSSTVRYRHNVAHDGSVARLLAILQVEEMVWPGMGAEVVFELYRKVDETTSAVGEAQGFFLRVLWGGQVLKSSSPTLGVMDMVSVDRVLAYFDALVGVNAAKIPGLCDAGA